MIDVKNKKCTLCNKQPTFGLINNKATHCLEHKTDEMKDCKHINVLFFYSLILFSMLLLYLEGTSQQHPVNALSLHL